MNWYDKYPSYVFDSVCISLFLSFICIVPTSIQHSVFSWFFRPASSTNNDFDTRYILGRRPGSTDELLKCSKTRADVQIVPHPVTVYLDVHHILPKIHCGTVFWLGFLQAGTSMEIWRGRERERVQAGITVKTDLRAEKYFFLISHKGWP